MDTLPVPENVRAATAADLSVLIQSAVYSASLNQIGDALPFLARGPAGPLLCLLNADSEPLGLPLAMRPVHWRGRAAWLGQGPTDHASAVRIRELLPFCSPVRLGTRTGAGLGDRLGLATPGHVRAVRRVPGIMPVFAQQSIREMERTERTPEQVLDDAMWGVMQEGWRSGYGADADHLKTTQDIDQCVSAGYVMYTFDPRDHVDNGAEGADIAGLRKRYAALPWARLATSPEQNMARYAGESWELGGGHLLVMSELDVLRAAAKYGVALAHLRDLYEHLRAAIGGRPWEVEVSVDETDTPTRPVEHWYIARELSRLGVEWVSLAPRYVGRFEKGVDYIGDLTAFERDGGWHVAISRALGPYKLSLHSGSDKFRIYPITARLGGELVHLKTAGTSYLEALRTLASVDPSLFREILSFSISAYEEERRSYHVSGELSRVPDPESLSDEQLIPLFDDLHARQVLHVAFGRVLCARDGFGRAVFRDRMVALLRAHEEAYYRALEDHLARHLTPYARPGRNDT